MKRVPDGLVLALDIGTSSVRSACFDLRGRRLTGTSAQNTYGLIYSEEGGAELLPGKLKHAALASLSKTLQRKPKRARILKVGTTCFWHSLLAVDEKNRPLTPIYTWADARAREDAASLRARFSERKIHARTGCMLRTSFWPAKLAWLARTQPDLKPHRWLSPAEWLQIEFSGGANCSLSMASGTGLFNPSQLEWDDELLACLNVKRSALGSLSDEAVAGGRLFTDLKNVPWLPATGDGAASNLGCRATSPGLAAINVGTSAALRVMKSGQQARSPFGLFCYRMDRSRFLVGGAVSNVGNLRAWCLRELQLNPARIEAELAARPAPTHGLTVLPFWTAERAPDWDETTPGTIIGITHKTTAIDLLQAITEASYQRIGQIAEALLKNETAIPKFIISGGILGSRSSIQRLADVLNQPLYLNDEPEATLAGAAISALESLQLRIEPVTFRNPVRPRARYAQIYAASRSRAKT